MKYEILDNAETISFSEVESLFSDFISKYVSNNRKDRWLALIKKQKQLSKKFGDLWDHLETEKSSPLKVEKLPKGTWLYYDGSNDPVYKISTQELQEVCIYNDGIAFLPSKKLAIFFTHEATEYVFNM